MAMAFDPATAVNYGRFVSVAYAMYTAAPNSPTPPPLPLPTGYKFIAWVQMQDFIIASSGWSFYGIVAQSMSDPNRFVLAIRGTSNPVEWFDDATSLILAPWAGQGHVGYGFNRIYQTLRIIDVAPQAPNATAAFADSLEEAGSFADQVAAMTHRHAAGAAAATGAPMTEALAQTSKRVDVVGHSLGSALATLYVAENASKGAHIDGTTVNTPLLCTFASPRVGDATFAAAFDNLGLTSWRVVNQLDVVPYLPPADFGFVHVQTPEDYNSGFRVRWSVGCWHALATYLHLLDPKMPLGSGCAVGAGATLAARVAPAAQAMATAAGAPSAALFEKTLTAAVAPTGRGTTVTIKITVDEAE
jgi:triacylglycerol lipase